MYNHSIFPSLINEFGMLVYPQNMLKMPHFLQSIKQQYLHIKHKLINANTFNAYSILLVDN